MQFINGDTNLLTVTVNGQAVYVPASTALNLELASGATYTTPDGVMRTNSPSGVCSFTATTSSVVAGFDWQNEGVNAFTTGLTHGSILAATILAIYGVRWVFGWMEEDDRWE
jgi:hypothetical protein